MPEHFCPCGSTAKLADCCGPLLNGDAEAQSPEALMRSRYSAWQRGDIDYLWNTLHPDYRADASKDQLQESAANTRWLSLRIIDAPTPAKDHGIVEFTAFFQASDGASAAPEQLHERSEFRRHNGRWHYTRGKFLPPLKTGRNDPCCCGSGKKQKKCHPNT